LRRLERRYKVYQFSRHGPPAIEVAPGEALTVETTDSADGQVDLGRPGLVALGAGPDRVAIDPHRAMPMTGPIYLRGAEPGDVVGIEVLGLVAEGNGFLLPGFDRLLEEESLPDGQEWARIAELRRGSIEYAEGLQLPYRLMVGSLGLAPAGDPVDTLTPGDHGGNHDCLHLRAGATLYLQVQVVGALVALGDVHATMGDGEVTGTGLECDGQVTVRLHLYKGRSIPGPLLATEDAWMVYGYGRGTDEAIAMARDRALELLVRYRGLTAADAAMLLAAVGDLRLNEVVNPNHSARVELPKRITGPLPWRETPERAAETALAYA
jgi:amidase